MVAASQSTSSPSIQIFSVGVIGMPASMSADPVQPPVSVRYAAELDVEQRLPDRRRDRSGPAVAGDGFAAAPAQRRDRRDDGRGAAGEHLGDAVAGPPLLDVDA